MNEADKEMVEAVCAYIDKALMEAIKEWLDPNLPPYIGVHVGYNGWRIDISIGPPPPHAPNAEFSGASQPHP